MKRATLLLLLALLPIRASALETKELLGLVAMPLAVAAVSEVTGVPPTDLSHLVATLNRAEVAPTQVVQVVRYAPAALVVEERRPTFVRYVDDSVDDGYFGSRLVTRIEDQYRAYDLEPEFVVLDEPATTYVVRDNYIPPVVLSQLVTVQPTRIAGDSNDLLSLIAMPLAVAAAAELTGIPMSDLGSLVASLNSAAVPPVQVVEVLRYAPVALVVTDRDGPRFIQFVETQVDRGVRGPALVEVIGQRLRTYDVTPDFRLVNRPRVTVIDRDQFFPPVVRTRVAAAREHPHGGPPGQIKKELGLQTGAEVVHGSSRARVARDRDDDRRVEVRRERAVRERNVTAEVRRNGRDDRKPRTVRLDDRSDKPRGRSNEKKVMKNDDRGPKKNDSPRRGGGNGKGNGQGKGKGKG